MGKKKKKKKKLGSKTKKGQRKTEEDRGIGFHGNRSYRVFFFGFYRVFHSIQTVKEKGNVPNSFQPPSKKKSDRKVTPMSSDLGGFFF